PLPVSYAAHDQLLPRRGQPGVILAPPDVHLLVRAGRLRLSHEAERHSCRPSVDLLFESLALETGAATLACVLTVMGKDGATGLRVIGDVGGVTIAQDEASSVVFAMPREAARLGGARHVLPLHQIGPTLRALIQQEPTSPRTSP